MEMFDVFSMNGIENVILKVSQTHFPKDFYPKGGPMPPLGFAKGGHKFFKGGQCPPRGAVKYPVLKVPMHNSKVNDFVNFELFKKKTHILGDVYNYIFNFYLPK